MSLNDTPLTAADRARAELFLASAFAEVMASQGGDLVNLNLNLPHSR